MLLHFKAALIKVLHQNTENLRKLTKVAEVIRTIPSIAQGLDDDFRKPSQDLRRLPVF